MRSVMRSVVLVAALALGVGGCSSGLQQQVGNFVQAVSGVSIPQDAVIVARSSFNAAQSLATSYLRLKRCTASSGPVCRDPALTKRIGEAVMQGRAARNRMAALMRANPGRGVPVADYNTMIEATAIINNLTAAYRAARG